MSRRRGFTLVEILVALVLAGVLAIAVYGSVAAALDTRERLDARRAALRSALAWRAVLGDALRNVQPPPVFGDTAFLLEDAAGPAGVPMDRLAFLAAGGPPPLTADADWMVALLPDPRGVRLVAAPVGVSALPREVLAPGGIRGADVRVLGADGSGEWLSAWDRAGELPAAIEITFWGELGPLGEPLRVSLPVAGGRP